jgi:hypothetical protein
MMRTLAIINTQPRHLPLDSKPINKEMLIIMIIGKRDTGPLL